MYWRWKTTRLLDFYENNLLYQSKPRLDTQDSRCYVTLCQYQQFFRVVPKIQTSVSVIMIKRSRFMMAHLYTMFSLYRKQSVDLFFQLIDLLPYDGNIVHKWLKITSANILRYRSIKAISIWFIIEVVSSPFQNKIDIIFEIQLVFWTAVILSWPRLILKICVKITVKYIFITTHFQLGFNIISLCQTPLKWFWKCNIYRGRNNCRSSAKFKWRLALAGQRDSFFLTIKMSARMY